jgi:hypothetical protein
MNGLSCNDWWCTTTCTSAADCSGGDSPNECVLTSGGYLCFPAVQRHLSVHPVRFERCLRGRHAHHRRHCAGVRDPVSRGEEARSRFHHRSKRAPRCR